LGGEDHTTLVSLEAEAQREEKRGGTSKRWKNEVSKGCVLFVEREREKRRGKWR